MGEMIEIAWYNVVAIIAVVVWLFWAGKDEGNDMGIGAAVKLFVLLLFIFIWGGIFWW